MSQETSSGLKDSAKAAKSAGKGTVKAAKGAKKAASDGIKITKFLLANPIALGIVLGVVFILLLSSILVGGTSSSQLADTYSVTPLKEQTAVEPSTEEEKKASIEDREVPVRQTEDLVSVVRESKMKERSSLDSQIVRLANEHGADSDLTLASVKEELLDSEVYEVMGGSSLGISDGAEKIASAAEKLAWPYGTSKSKYCRFNGGGATSKCMSVYRKLWPNYATSSNASVKTCTCCCHFAKTCVCYGLDKKFGFNLLPSNSSDDASLKTNMKKKGFTRYAFIDSKGVSQLKRGDVCYYRNKGSGGHVFIYLGDGKAAEASHGAGYGGRITKLSSTKQTTSGKTVFYYFRYNDDSEGASANEIDPTATDGYGSIQDAAIAWAKKVVDEQNASKKAGKQKYHYVPFSLCKKSCPFCYNTTGKKCGWQCIGFVSAAYHHAGLTAVTCSASGLGWDGEGGSLNKTPDSELINFWNKRNGGQWELITNDGKRNGKSVDESKLKPGDVLLNFGTDGMHKHMILYAGDGKCYDCTSDVDGPRESKYSHFKHVTRVLRYTGTQADTSSVITISKQDIDILSAYSVSLSNSALTLKDEKESSKKVSGNGVLDETTYIDMAGDGVKLYWFGKKKGQINYIGDLRKKIFERKVKGFYTLTTGGFGTAYDEDGNEIKYLKVTIKENDIDTLAKELFKIPPEEPYVNAEVYARESEENSSVEEDAQTEKSYTTNSEAIKTLSENTVHLIYEGLDVSTTELCLAGNGQLADPLGHAKYVITSYVGYRPPSATNGVGTTNHAGLDMAAPTGTPIYASLGGTVKVAGWYGGYGLAVVISSGDYEITYGHCSKVLVSKGQVVPAGKNIALVGSTGHSTGPHLHFEVHYKGKVVDPYPLIKGKS